MTTVPELQEEFEALYEQWFTAAVARDTGTFETLLDDVFIYTDIFGTVRGKPEYVGLIQALPPNGLSMTMECLRTRRCGDHILVTGEYAVDGRLVSGEDITSQTRFTALWAPLNGGWRCLMHHATRQSEPAA